MEWRRSGFDPTRTAPLDDVPESKDRRAPIQETVGLFVTLVLISFSSIFCRLFAVIDLTVSKFDMCFRKEL